MSFAIDVRQWKTIDEFKTHLSNYDEKIVPWARGVVIHHTWAPRLNQWRGIRSIKSIADYYKKLVPAWTAGPHLFIAAGSPKKEDDGIFQMTPLNLQGVHARIYNSTHWGIEVVGNYDEVPWSIETKELVHGATLALLNWKKIAVSRESLLGHRETGSPKSCPGKKIDMDIVRLNIAMQQGVI